MRKVTRSFCLLAVTSVVMSLGTASSAFAQEASEAQKVLAQLRKSYAGTQFTSVSKSPLPGIFEVVMGKNVAYTDTSGRIFLFGQMMDMQTQVNLTQERMSELTKIDPVSLPLNQAVKTVKGDGSRILYVFADPECGYCKQLERTIAQLENATIYTFLYPVLGARSAANAEAIWCAADRSKAWEDYMTVGGAVAPVKCANPISKNIELGESLGITGTPTIITASGQRVPGAVPLDRLNTLLSAQSPKIAKAK
jgi:thiol:disulfide interchange protein DsbC